MRVRWEDVDLDQRLLSLRGSKTDAATDTIPLTPLAHAELRRWRLSQGEPTEGVVFLAPTSRWGGLGDEPYSGAGGYRGVLDRTATIAGIERRVTPKLLRKSFATIAWSLGVPMDVARRILRHTDETMIRRVYCRPRPADLVAQVAAFDIDAR